MARNLSMQNWRGVRGPGNDTSKGPEARKCKVGGWEARGTTSYPDKSKGHLGSAGEARNVNQEQPWRTQDIRCLGPRSGAVFQRDSLDRLMGTPYGKQMRCKGNLGTIPREHSSGLSHWDRNQTAAWSTQADLVLLKHN